MGDFDSSEYYNALKQFSTAVENFDFVKAAWFLRQGLELSPGIAEEWGKAERPPAHIPFVGGTAACVAAIVQDFELLPLMEAVAPLTAKNPGIDQVVVVGLYRHLFDLVSYVREEIQSPEAKLSQVELSRSVPEELKYEVSGLLRYMEKAGELTRVKEGGRVFITKRVDKVELELIGSKFRENETPVIADTLKLPNPPAIEWAPISDANETIEVRTALLESVPNQERLLNSGTVYPFRSGQWLVGAFPTPLVDPVTKVLVKNWNGMTINSFEIPGRYRTLHTSTNRDTAIFISREKDVAVYDFHGELLEMFTLSSTPELLEFQDRYEPQPELRSIVRAIDVSPINQDRVFTAVNTLWWFTQSGELRTALTFGDDAMKLSKPGVFTVEISPRDDSDALALDGKSDDLARVAGSVSLTKFHKQPLEPYEDDWIYFARFSQNEDELFVGFYSGRFLRLSASGMIIDSWQIGKHSASDVVETDAKLFVLGFEGYAELLPSGAGNGVVFRSAYRGRVISERLIMTRHESDFQIIDTETNLAQSLELTRPLKAIYSAGTSVIFDMGAKKYALSPLQ
jgi:hypothetical protein